MTKKPAKAKTLATAAGDYASLLSDLKQRIRAAQVRAAMMGNASTLMLYWEIGSELLKRQKQEGWGTKVLPRLASDLKNELPEEKGFSERNLKRMQRFAREYPGLFPIVPQPVAQLDGASSIRPRAVAKFADKTEAAIGQPAVAQIVPQAVALLPTEPAAAQVWQQAVAKLTWAHNIILFEKVKDLPTRLWYARQAFEHGWGRDMLSLQIQSRAHERQGKAVTNFHRTLPPPQSDLAAQLLKDPYVFDFLTLEKPFHERELETGLLRHLQDFLVELGSGFAKKITYKTYNPETKRYEKSETLIQEFRTSPQLRIAVTVDMIATGTDITASRESALSKRGATSQSPAASRDNPLECLLFLRDTRSRTYFEQMKGRGTRVLTPTDLQAVSGADARAKTHFVIVDAVGVCESDKTDSRPLERQRTVPLKTLLQRVLFPGGRDEESPATLRDTLLPMLLSGDFRVGTEIHQLT